MHGSGRCSDRVSVLMDCMHVVPDIQIECMHAGVHLEKLSRGAKVAG